MWDVRPLLTLGFWFNTNPPPFLQFFERFFLFVYLFALVLAIILGVFERKKKGWQRTFFEKMRRLATLFGFGGLLLSFFAYERTPFFSMRLFIFLLWLGAFVWKVLILRWYFKIVPLLVRASLEQKAFEKYLPR